MAFTRILVGFDGSPASVRALSAAEALRAEDGTIETLTVAETYQATHAGMDAPAWDLELRERAVTARALAEEQLASTPGSQAAIVAGYAGPSLLACASRIGADLIAVGAHGHSRMAGILLGSVATRIAHDARSSVLVARGTRPLTNFPREIVVGCHDSPACDDAVALTEALAASTGAHVRHLTAPGSPVEALVEASREADLVVLGSRGRHGLASLGSVGERVAHEADCPVLIVRGVHSGNEAPHAVASVETG